MTYIMQKYGDVVTLSNRQHQKLCEMMYQVFLEIRRFAIQEPKQMSELADAFRNLPAMLYSNDFSMKYFRLFLQSYHEQYPNKQSEKYLQMLDKIIKEENL